jgi:hypothetical protein
MFFIVVSPLNFSLGLNLYRGCPCPGGFSFYGFIVPFNSYMTGYKHAGQKKRVLPGLKIVSWRVRGPFGRKSRKMPVFRLSRASRALEPRPSGAKKPPAFDGKRATFQCVWLTVSKL